MTTMLSCSVWVKTGTKLQSRASQCQIIGRHGRKQNYRESLGSTAGKDTPSVADMVGCLPVEKCFPTNNCLSVARFVLWLFKKLYLC